MKTKITICTILITLFAVVMFFSCEIPLALGTKLDIEGPVVEITYPSHRKTVQKLFNLTGTVKDKTGVNSMLITAKVDNEAFPRQWLYQNGAWQVSDNYGASWAPFADGEWNGNNNYGLWKIPVNMDGISGYITVEGEYTFTVQAWDKADFTDDNSIKAVIVILDLNPPKVDVSNPPLYKGAQPYIDNPDFKKLHDIQDNGLNKEYEDPAYLGKFITQEFDLKWQVEDMNDVWSIDLRFYKYDVAIDNDPNTALPDDYIYRFYKNLPPVPDNVSPADYIRPNGTVIIPDLTSSVGIYDQGGELKDPLPIPKTTDPVNGPGKTTIKIVAVSYDASGKPNQEKTIGYFIYWPRANNPWIKFPEGMEVPVYYPAAGSAISTLENTAYTVYPSKDIKATAYQAYGVKRIEYTVYSCGTTGVTDSSKGNITSTLTAVPGLSNSITSQVQSTILGWSFQVPQLTGYYVVKATAFSFKEKASKEYELLFRVNDITFPDFPTPIQPAASEPLYLAKNNNGTFNMTSNGTQFTISGTVSDATSIDSLCLVWINPQSKGAAANSQLVYFRDKDYVGWIEAKKLTPSAAANGQSTTEGNYDASFPNRLWRLNPVYQGIDPDTNRRIYTFTKVINLSDLNIDVNLGVKSQPLKSQMFLFRAENPVDKCTIITYAPQGDTVTPAIKIKNVVIRETSSPTSAQKGDTLIPNQYSVIPIFAAGNSINISGKWREDSVANLNLTTFFKNNFDIKINNTPMYHLVNQPSLTVEKYTSTSDPDRTDDDGTWDGYWTLTTVVGNGAGQVPLEKLKDTLVIDVQTKDIGGNVAQLGNSWLIKSDKLQLLRISSDTPDDIYGKEAEIEIFLEFSRPVQLSPSFDGNKGDIQLILSTASGNTARARYRTTPPQDNQNSRQYFVYKVGDGENTTTPEYLNVTGLYYNGASSAGGNYPGAFTTTTAFNQANYPFAWSMGASEAGSFEEVRLTMQTGKTGNQEGSSIYYVRTLPTSTTSTNADYQYTLFAAKHIKIDTELPRISSISTTTPAGYYSAGDIYFTIKFSENVKLGSATPQFPLNFNNNIVWSSDKAADVRVNADSITFKYTIVSPDSSGGKQIYVSANTAQPMKGDIYDIAGNKLLASPNAINANPPGNGLTSLSETDRTLTNNGYIYVETQAPSRPTVRVFKNIFTRGTGTSTTYTLNNHGFANNTPIYVNSSATVYYVRNPATNTIQIAATSGGTTYLNLGDTIYVSTSASTANVISQGVKVTTITTNYGASSESNRNLSNVYEPNLYLAIQKNATNDNATTPYKCDYMEYSIDNGSNWIKVANNDNNPFSLERTGDYKIIARQVDKAGNKSASTDAVNFNWDPGDLITRVSSSSANGEYTHVAGRNTIDITLTFRKPLFFSGTANPYITLNATDSANAAKIVTATRPTVRVSSLTFTYTVANGDKTPTGQNLKITAFSPGANVDVFDENNAGVLVNNLLTPLPDLDATKEFTVVTGALEFTTAADTAEFPGQPAFIADNFGGTGYNDTTSSNYHGIREDDGSYWTTLRMTYNHNITKGDGNIIIRQIQGAGTGSYRLPTVMTEAQYNRFKGITDFNTYYIKGTNGYKYISASDQGSDTTNKYILQYKYDPRRDVTANNTGFTGNTFVPQTFIDDFRNAETIIIPVNSQAVTLTNGSLTAGYKTLNIRLSGSNAPQVPGATYEVILPKGLVVDSLGNESADFTKEVVLRGVAKPFVRIKKPQETIKIQPGNSSTPRIAVDVQPMLANARIDCRTPNSTITYNASTGSTNVTGGNSSNGTDKGNNNWYYNAVPDDNTANYPNPPAPNAARPANATGAPYTNSNQITFGYTSGTTAPTIDNVQGFQWWVRAQATTTAANNNTSAITEEMAYRTVISFTIRNSNNRVNLGTGRSNFEDGDQAWIRGGDSIGSSSIPGFPFTWEDNWDTLKEKRAGIRLMTLVSTVTSASWSATKDNAATNTYTAANNNWPSNLTSGETVTITVNNTEYTAYIVSNSNRTFRVYTLGTNGNNGNNNGISFGANGSTITFTMKDLNNSLWRFVTWDLNTTAYVDFIRGRDLTEGTSFTESTANVAWQYGPKRWCYQVDGWTAFKDRYPIYAGKHRWCDMGTTMGQHGTMNFSGTFMGRPDKLVDYTNVNQQ